MVQILVRFVLVVQFMIRVSNPGIRDSESWDPGRFPNPDIPGLSRCQSRDFGIITFYVLNFILYFFLVNITHLSVYRVD